MALGEVRLLRRSAKREFSRPAGSGLGRSWVNSRVEDFGARSNRGPLEVTLRERPGVRGQARGYRRFFPQTLNGCRDLKRIAALQHDRILQIPQLAPEICRRK